MKKLTLRQMQVLEAIALKEIARRVQCGEPIDRSLSIARWKLTEGIALQRAAEMRRARERARAGRD